MAKPFDDEFHITSIIAAVKSSMNTKIAAINAEKSDTVVLREVEENAYFYDTWGNELPNYDPCVIFAVNVQPTGTVGDTTSQRIEILIQLVFASTIAADPLDLYRFSARYRRVLKELAEAVSTRPRANVIPLGGSSFVVKKGGLYYTVGVGIEINIA